ncbi:SDR family NAD(P)-dependent oxidoreductase [Streptomyces sioyaensis]|uniref:SDR family NAD(P)-dependent oxidoreductase n=1 Tax=Streptomyces sioyaensis TaxID=67364 RepID=UPI0037D15FAA
MSSRAVPVTGGSRGIGRAAAELFAARGDRVARQDASRREAAQEAFAGPAGGGHVLVRGDVGTPEGAAAIVEAAVDGLGGVDVLVNNAAANEPHPLDRTSFEDWQRVWRRLVDVNLLGAAHLTHCAARNMIERGGGGARGARRSRERGSPGRTGEFGRGGSGTRRGDGDGRRDSRRAVVGRLPRGRALGRRRAAPLPIER